MIRVLLADDHDIVRDGLTRLINETPGRLGVGLFMLLFWVTYFFAFRRDVDGAPAP